LSHLQQTMKEQMEQRQQTMKEQMMMVHDKDRGEQVYIINLYSRRSSYYNQKFVIMNFPYR
ncbi:MAG: hypothetical protein ACJ70V_01615, partial [Nitrososphaera sp.]